MNEYFRENKRALILITVALFILAIVLFFFLLRPLVKDLSSKKDAINSAEGELHILEQKIATYTETNLEYDIDQLVYEKKIPLERMLDEYILSLQRLELITKSKIEKIEFVYDSQFEMDETESEAEELVEQEDELLMEENDSQNEDESEVGEVVVDPVIMNEKPEELQEMTVKLTAISPDFKEFIEFLKVIENQERISIVTKLYFLRPTEVDTFFAENPLETVPFEVELTTFYYAE